MIVECPSCHTRYRTEVAGAVDETTFFECSQADCGHVFQSVPPVVQIDHLPEQHSEPEATLSQVPAQIPAQAPAQAPADDPAFTFSNSLSSSDALTTQPSVSDLSAEQNLQEQADQDWSDSISPDLATDAAAEAADSTDFAQSAQSNRQAETDHFNPARQPERDNFPSTETPFFDEDQTNEGRIELTPLPTPTPRETVFSLKLLVLFLGLIVAGYAGCTFVAFSYLEETAAVFSHVPVLGPLLDAERPSARHIALTKMRGSFWHTNDGHQIFAIAGRAVNQAGVPVQSIQIEGTLLSVSGKTLGQRHIFCGTETAPEVLESLTRRQVQILQSLMPPKQFRVPAGEGVDFLITFTEPPEQVVEFSSRIVAAQFGRPY